jgi:hypothetical protein
VEPESEYLYADLGKVQASSGLVGTAGGGAGPIESGAFAFNHNHYLRTKAGATGKAPH